MTKQLQTKLLELAGPTASVRDYSEKDWASTTFAGTKHTITFFFKSIDAADKFAELIREEEVDVNLVGELLVDMDVKEFDAIVPVNHATVTVEALTLKDK